MERLSVTVPADGQKLRVLVCGATGYIGKYLIKELHKQGFWIRALVRDESRLEDTKVLVDHVFKGEATIDSSLKGVCEGIDVVISVLGLGDYGTIKSAKPSVWDVDHQANINILNQCVISQVRHFVFLTVLRGREIRSKVPQAEARERVVDTLRDLNRHGFSKSERALTWTVVRSSAFYKDIEELFYAATGPIAPVIGDGGMRINPIHGEDLAAFIVEEAVKKRASRHKSELDVGGSEVLPVKDIYSIAFEVARKPGYGVSGVKPWMLSVGAAVAKPFNVNVSSVLSMLLALSSQDGVAEYKTGHHTFKPFFVELYNGKPSKEKPGAFEFTVYARSHYFRILPADASAVGSTIEWVFSTQKMDIEFGLFFLEDDDGVGSGTPLVPSALVTSHLEEISGQHRIDKPGFYVLRWSNAHSKYRSKRLTFRITLVDARRNHTTPFEHVVQAHGGGAVHSSSSARASVAPSSTSTTTSAALAPKSDVVSTPFDDGEL